MDKASAHIDNLDEMLSWCDQRPEVLLRQSRSAMRSAASRCTRDMKKAVPSRFAGEVTYKVKPLGSGSLNAGIGLFNQHRRQGGPHFKHGKQVPEVDDWFKAYWLNYGTRSKRDPSHRFDYPVKRNTHPRGGGIAPRHFFEGALQGMTDKFLSEFDKALERAQAKLEK